MSSQSLPYYPLKLGRMHEVYGPGAVGFASVLMAHLDGKVLWVRATHNTEEPNPLGLVTFIDPSRLLIAKASDQVKRLAVAEEALREGAVPLVIIDIDKPLNLTAGRRLQLASKIGDATGLCLIPEGMGSNAAQTRWHAAPVLSDARDDSTLFRWSLMKNKSGTNGSWYVRWDHTAHRLNMVSPVGERPGSEVMSD